MAEVRTIKFSSEFQKNLFPDNSFYLQSRKDTAPSPDVTSIEIPQATTPVPSTFGAIQAGQANLDVANKLDPRVRLNDKKSYDVNVFGTESTALQGIDLKTFSYEKRSELLQEHADVVNTQVANYAAIEFAQDTANTDLIVKTTSTETRDSIVTGGATAPVKRIAKNDVFNVKRIFHRMNIPNVESGLYGLITPEQWQDLLLIPEFVDYDKTGMESKLKQGLVGKLLGFEFYVRQNEDLNANVVYNETTLAKIAYQGAVAATDTSAAIFWHRSLVRHTQGAVKLFLQSNNPIYKADVMSTDVRFGATKSRTDGRGVVSLVESL